MKYCLPALLCAFLLLCACGRPHGDMPTLVEYAVDNKVHVSPMNVNVTPMAALERRPRALFMPLRVLQDVQHHVTLGRSISRQVWQTWLSMNLFEVLQFEESAGPWDPSSAIALGRRLGAEVVCGGYINSYLDGGAEGKSSATLQIEIYDVKSGSLLFSLAQAGLMEDIPARDYYVFSVKERMPLDSAALVIRTVSHNMGLKIAEWTDTVEMRARRKGEDKDWLSKSMRRTAF